MSEASDLIERVERETGQRVDAGGGDNLAMTALFGALARAMDISSHREGDDLAAGVVIRHQMTPEYYRGEEAKQMIASMLAAGLSPDDLKSLFG